VLVVNGRSRTGQVVDLVHLHIEREGHVVAHQLGVRVIQQMRAEKAGAANDKGAGAEFFI
jgi:hypothetical protein